MSILSQGDLSKCRRSAIRCRFVCSALLCRQVPNLDDFAAFLRPHHPGAHVDIRLAWSGAVGDSPQLPEQGKGWNPKTIG